MVQLQKILDMKHPLGLAVHYQRHLVIKFFVHNGNTFYSFTLGYLTVCTI